MINSEFPRIRLRPNAMVQKFRHGFPWVYDNELVMDRRSRKIVPGSLAVLESAERQPLALVTVNPASKIVARVLVRDPEVQIDQAWITGRLQKALALRERLYDAPFYRLVHAEADGFPGVIIDRFGDTAVIQPNAAWAESGLEMLCAALVEVTGVKCVLKNAAGRARSLEGLDDKNVVLFGAATKAPIPVAMNGAVYMADPQGGQKTGLFYDQRPNHAFAAKFARGARMAAPLVEEGGYLGLCSCSHAADLARFRAASLPGMGRAGRPSALIHTGFAGPDHPVHPQLAESHYLKVLFFRL